MTREEFILAYTRIHFEIYDNDKWRKISASYDWLKNATDLYRFQASELFSYLVNIGELKDDSLSTDKSCTTCKTKNVCKLRHEKINDIEREFCEGYEA